MAMALEPDLPSGHAPGDSARSGDLPVAVPRLARHTFTLDDGHRVGVAVAGRGVPLVVVHGFTAEGFLYAQSLHRLVRKGFKVVAIDMAGHGGSQGLPSGPARLGDYSELMSHCIEQLGIRRAVLAGHSMGGRVVAGLGASHPDQVVGLLLIDAIVGDEWDRLVNVMRLSPPLLAAMGVALVADTATTLPVLRDRQQAAKLWSLVTPTLVGHALQPWRLVTPGLSILRSRGSRTILDELGRRQVPTFVITGDRDLIVPPCAARSAAVRAKGHLVRIEGAGHSWLLKDPETLPAVVEDLLAAEQGDRGLGAAIRAAIPAAGAASVDELEEHFYEADAPILAMTPDLTYQRTRQTFRPARYRWTISEPWRDPAD